VNVLPLVTNDLQTLDNVAVTLVTVPLSIDWQGELTCEVSGELAGTPATAYGWRNRVTVSCDAGVATVQATGAAEVIDPAVCGCVVSVDATGASIRVRVAGVALQTWNWVGKVQCIVHSRIPSNTVAYYDPSWAAGQTPYQDFVYTGVNVCTDPNCENVALWAAFNGATLTNVGGGVAGNCMRVAYNAMVFPGADQVILAGNARYYYNIWTRGDGTHSGNVNGGNFSPWITGAAANVWAQYIGNKLCVPGDNTLRCFVINAAVAGQYAEFDSIIIQRTPIVTGSDNLITGGTPLTQPGAVAARPTYLNTAAALAQGITGACHQYDGVGQYWVTSFVPPAEFTAGGWFYVANIVGTSAFAGSHDGAVTYCHLVRIAAALYARVGTGASLAHGTALTVGWHHIMFGRSGTTETLWLDGVSVSSAAATNPPVLPFYVMARNNTGAADIFQAGYTGKLWFCNRLLSDAEVLSLMYSTFRS
jgi:hypothetical protein